MKDHVSVKTLNLGTQHALEEDATMGLTVYIGSPCKNLARQAKEAVVAAGHEVVSDWHDRDGDSSDKTPHGKLRDLADIAVTAISTADVFVLVNDAVSISPGDDNFEAGVAVGSGVPVVSVFAIPEGTKSGTMVNHELVTQFDNLDKAVESIPKVYEEHVGEYYGGDDEDDDEPIEEDDEDDFDDDDEDDEDEDIDDFDEDADDEEDLDDIEKV